MVDPLLVASNLGTAAIAAGAGGGMVAWRKAGTEQESIAVETLRSVIKTLRTELERKELEIRGVHQELDHKQQEIAGLRIRVDALDHDLEQLVSDPPAHLT